jgi:hypothetical protein
MSLKSFATEALRGSEMSDMSDSCGPPVQQLRPSGHPLSLVVTCSRRIISKFDFRKNFVYNEAETMKNWFESTTVRGVPTVEASASAVFSFVAGGCAVLMTSFALGVHHAAVDHRNATGQFLGVDLTIRSPLVRWLHFVIH